MPLNDPVLVHWIDPDLAVRPGVAAVLGLICFFGPRPRGALMLTLLRLIERRYFPDEDYTP